MNSKPKFVFGSSYALFFSAPSQNVFHQNAAFQIVLGIKDDIDVLDENNTQYSGRAVLIRPMIKSQIRCDGELIHLFLSPIMSFTLDLINLIGDANIQIQKNSDRLPFNSSTPWDEIIRELNKLEKVSIKRLDQRLLAVLEDLNQNLDNPSILDSAKRSGLSRSRVRTLAREQMGIPLSTWVTWRKLIKANKALSEGANISDAALAGHFADQAHFSRTMKRMFGITPTQASLVYT